MAGPEASFDPTSGWKRHIVRQLQQRDRTQKALFLELVPAYNHLLEKAELLAKFSEKLHKKPNDVISATHQSFWEESGPDSDQSSPPGTLRVKWQEEEEEGLRLDCGEMAYQVVKKSAALDALQSELEERQSRLAAVEARVAQLREARAQQVSLVEELQKQNAAQRKAYEALRLHTGHQEAALRKLQEEVRDRLEQLLQRKERAAAECNLRNERRERANQARVSQELKKAAKRTVSISEIPHTLHDGIREQTETLALAIKPESLESEACGKWKRPFRSSQGTKISSLRPNGNSHSIGKLRLRIFKKRRGHSIGGAPEQRYQSIPVCVAARLPTWAQDVLDAHLSEVNAVCFGPNSSLLATGGADCLIHLWNVVGGRLEANQTLEGAGGSITSVDFDPSGSQVLAATYNQAAQLWKVGEARSKTWDGAGNTVWTQGQGDSCQIQANKTPGGDWEQRPDSEGVGPWPCLLGPRCTQVIPVQGRVTSLSLSHDQLHLLICSRDNTLKVIDLRVSNIRQVFRADGFKCGSDWTKAVFSPDRSYALAGSSNGALYIWDVDTGKLESSLQGPHCAAINAVAWCCSGSHVVSVDQGRKVVLWR
ncbi:protein Atg16l2 isoform 4-T4 [Callospermophilus lateralis]|uniref:protein Atg16l2 isoform X4 n=1 Tax=Callospermophilus lateralis TaxID=76772 RepID=UPI004038EB71